MSVEQGTNIDLLAKLRRRELDLVIGRLADAPLMFDLSFEPLYEEPLVLIAAKGHPLDSVRAPSMSKVFAYPVILPERDTIIRATLEPVLIAAGLRTPPRAIETLSSAFASQLVIQSQAVWFCAPGVVARELADGRCVALDIDLGPTRRAVGLSARGDAPLSPAAAEMAELLRLQARRMRRKAAAVRRLEGSIMTPSNGQARRRALTCALGCLAATGGWSSAVLAQIRESTADEQSADADAFAPVRQRLADRWTDVESVAVILQGRTIFEFYRDGAPDRLRNVQSVEKSALSALVGVALAQSAIASVDQPVVALVPEWAPLNPDPRTAAITVRHLLTMSAGFDIGSATAITGRLPPDQAWRRPLAAAPGERFTYDNAIPPLIAALLERVTGMRLSDYARRELVQPLGLAEPSYRGGLHLRTQDMARLGQLFLQLGRWGDRQIAAARLRDWMPRGPRTAAGHRSRCPTATPGGSFPPRHHAAPSWPAAMQAR